MHGTVKQEALICRINRRLKFPSSLELCYPLAASTMLADTGWFIHGSMDTGTQIYWATMTIALKDWNISDSTAWFWNLLPSFKPAWMERHHVSSLGAAGQRIWAATHTGASCPDGWLSTTSAGHSPPRGYSLNVRTCPKFHSSPMGEAFKI